MNKERSKQALRRNIEMTQGALDKAEALINDRDEVALTFPNRIEEFVTEMKRKIQSYRERLRQIDSSH